MERTLTLALSTLLCIGAQAQKQPSEDLLVKYVDEKYEDCLGKAINYTEKDDTKKDPLPYLYASMCLYEMSKIPKYTAMDEYKKAATDALKYADKFRKKDKNKEFFDNYADYWGELNTMAQEMGLNFYDQGAKGYSKSKQIFENMATYYPENPGPWLMLSLSQYNTNLVKEGDASMAKFRAALDAAGAISTFPDDQKKLMKSALIDYAAFLDKRGDKAKAKETIEIGKESFKDDVEYKAAVEQYK